MIQFSPISKTTFFLPTVKRHIRYTASYFSDASNGLYRRSFTGLDLRVVHEGSFGCHSGVCSLVDRELSQGYWWKKIKHSAHEYAKARESCQKHALLHHQPTLSLKPISSPWPFARWGIDIIGELPKALGGFKYLITATDYYTKWVTTKALVHITAAEMESFLWKHIILRFGVPYAVVPANGTQLVADRIQTLYRRHKAISAGLKRRLTNKRDKWVEELPKVLWGYRTTPWRGIGRTHCSMAYSVETVFFHLLQSAPRLVQPDLIFPRMMLW